MDEIFKDKIKEQCQVFMEKYGNAYINEILRLEIPVRMTETLHQYPYLFKLLLHNPTEAFFVLKIYIYTTILDEAFLPGDFQDENLMIVPRLDWFPTSSAYRINPENFSEALEGKRFFRVDAILSSISKAKDYTQCAKFKCPNEECNRWMADFTFVRLHVPGVTEWDLTKPDFKCLDCGCVLEEDKKSRRLGRKCLATVIPTKTLNLGFEKTVLQKLTLCVRDELIELLELGQSYNVIGLPIILAKTKKTLIDVNNLIKIQKYVCKVPLGSKNRLFQMASGLDNAPWSHCLNLAYYFASHVASPGFVFKVKLGLLISLIGIDNDDPEEWKNGSLFVIGHDTEKIKRLFRYASRFCDRRVQHSSSVNVATFLRKEVVGGAIEGGSLELANGGVCLIDENSLTKAHIDTLNSFLIQGQHRVVNETETYRSILRTRVWASNNITGKGKRPTSAFTSGFSGMLFSKPLPIEPTKTNQAYAFSLVYSIENPEDDDYICQCELEHFFKMTTSETNEQDDDIIAESDWRAFLEAASHTSVTFTQEAKDLLMEYFVASRNASDQSGKDLPVMAMSKLLFLSKAFAKLRLQSDVTETHAIMAIYTVEEMNSALCGYSSTMLEAEFNYRPERDHELKFQQFKSDLRRVLTIKASQCIASMEE